MDRDNQPSLGGRHDVLTNCRNFSPCLSGDWRVRFLSCSLTNKKTFESLLKKGDAMDLLQMVIGAIFFISFLAVVTAGMVGVPAVLLYYASTFIFRLTRKTPKQK